MVSVQQQEELKGLKQEKRIRELVEQNISQN
jgi:hypothetical protein